MNALRLLVFFFICEETLLAAAPAFLTFSQNRLYPEHDHVLSVIVSSYRSFKDTILSVKSLIKDSTFLPPRCLGSRTTTMNFGTMNVILQQES
jgi:hypothetical protein